MLDEIWGVQGEGKVGTSYLEGEERGGGGGGGRDPTPETNFKFIL